MNGHTNIFVQARMGSSRLPGKALKRLKGKTIIEWVATRLLNVDRIHNLVYLIPDTSENDILCDVIQRLSHRNNIVRGCEHDVFSRFVEGIRCYPCNQFIRVCADNPLICWAELNRLVDEFLGHHCRYAFNHIPRGTNYADGFGAEIVDTASFLSLEQLNLTQTEREHVFNGLHRVLEEREIRTFDSNLSFNASNLRFDCDTQSDLNFLETLNMDPSQSMSEILRRNFCEIN